MKYRTEFPDYDNTEEADAIVAAGWLDRSWRNEPCPSFIIGRTVLWLDYADADKREHPEMGRYVIQRVDGHGAFMESDEARDFPSLKEALGAVYVDRIGYNPFADDPAISESEVARILAEYERESANAVADERQPPLTVKLLIGANAYACIEENGRKTDIRLDPGKGAAQSLREYAESQTERANRIAGMADLATRAAALLDGKESGK